ncbi:MAG: type II secretion system protein [candidate division KSB1 bacterium]|nr:type II secretion system protein [candidate division KSB1 bacterium]
MLNQNKSQRGFSLAELLIVVAIIAVLASIVVMNMGGSDTSAREAKLRANVKLLRGALTAFYADHGFYPCTSMDAYNKNGDQTKFKRQLTWYTDERGYVSRKKSGRYRFGPYLKEFPENPFYTDKSKADQVVIDRKNERILEDLVKAVQNANGNNGWYYEAKSGNIVPNLGGATFPDKYVEF